MSTANDGFRGLTPPGKTSGRLLMPLVFLAAAIDFLVPVALGNIGAPVLGILFFGAFFGQLGLLTVWAVLGPQRLFVRWPLAWLVGWFLCGTFVLSSVVDSSDSDITLLDLFSWGALFLPAIFVAVQLPLWILKAITGCRIIRGDDERVAPAELRQFGVQQMMTVTAVAAVTLGLARLGMSETHAPGVGVAVEAWGVLSQVCFWFSIWGALVVVPCVCAIFLPRNLGPGVVGAVLYSLALTVIAILVCGALSGGSLPGEASLALLAFAIGLMGTQLGVLSMLRRRGYRLQRVSGKPLPGDADVATDPDVPATSPFGDDFEAP